MELVGARIQLRDDKDACQFNLCITMMCTVIVRIIVQKRLFKQYTIMYIFYIYAFDRCWFIKSIDFVYAVSGTQTYDLDIASYFKSLA